jgi:hypothetical protein
MLSYLDLPEEIVASHLRHPVVRDDHAHIRLLNPKKTAGNNVQRKKPDWSHFVLPVTESTNVGRVIRTEPEPSISSALFPLSTAVTASSTESQSFIFNGTP